MARLAVVNQHRRRAFARYARKAFSPGGAAKLANPATIGRALKTLTANRNLRTVPADELLSNAEAAIAALARIAPKPSDRLSLRPSIDTDELGDLFARHGSDKSTEHDYYEVYGSLLDGKRNDPLRILEIGLGTNNLAFQSNMGLGGRPGASLRAFRDWAPNAEVSGADIDRGVLFEEERVKTYFVDQTDTASLADLASKVGGSFDLIIDDGLHLPHANLNTIEALLPLLKPSGAMVIEDIETEHLNWWRAAAIPSCKTYLIERRGGWLVVIKPH